MNQLLVDAQNLYNQELYDEAENVYEKILEKEPFNLDALCWKCLYEMAKGNEEKGNDYYKKVSNIVFGETNPWETVSYDDPLPIHRRDYLQAHFPSQINLDLKTQFLKPLHDNFDETELLNILPTFPTDPESIKSLKNIESTAKAANPTDPEKFYIVQTSPTDPESIKFINDIKDKAKTTNLTDNEKHFIERMDCGWKPFPYLKNYKEKVAIEKLFKFIFNITLVVKLNQGRTKIENSIEV